MEPPWRLHTEPLRRASKGLQKGDFLRNVWNFKFFRFGRFLLSDLPENRAKSWKNIRARTPQKLVYVAPQETPEKASKLGGL